MHFSPLILLAYATIALAAAIPKDPVDVDVNKGTIVLCTGFSEGGPLDRVKSRDAQQTSEEVNIQNIALTAEFEYTLGNLAIDTERLKSRHAQQTGTTFEEEPAGLNDFLPNAE